MIEICNLRKQKPTEPYDVKVDRTSALGNPFYMKNESERDKVCKQYQEWFYEELFDSVIQAELWLLKDILTKYGKLRLFCWCSPKRCHAETIRDYILKSL